MELIKHNLSFGTLTKRKSTSRCIIHHEAGHGTVEQIHNSHKNENGWAGIGYHIFVDVNGNIHEGRPIWAIGAHAGGANYNSIGVCFEGNYEEEQMPEAQKEAGKKVVAWLKSEYGITIFQKHSDVCRTACPGKNFPFEEIVNGSSSKPVIVPNVPEAKPLPNIDGKKAIVLKGQKLANKFLGTNIKEDGIRGNETISAGIMVLQKCMNADYKVGLKIDGIFGTNSNRAFGHHYVRQGETQYMVTACEILLLLKGYDCQTEIPGIFGNNLASVVEQYQRDYQLNVDKVVGRCTFMSLIH